MDDVGFEPKASLDGSGRANHYTVTELYNKVQFKIYNLLGLVVISALARNLAMSFDERCNRG